MKASYVVLLLIVALGVVLTVLSLRSAKAHTALAPTSNDAGFDYKVALPVIAPSHPSDVSFAISPASARPGTQAWSATYSADGHAAHFLIEIDQSDRTETHGIPMHFGKGRLRRTSDSDPQSFLSALAFALDGALPKSVDKRETLVFDYVRFGDHMSPVPGGGFQFKPAGDWTVMKFFFDGLTEADSATVYFSLDAEHGQASFLMSNSDYGNGVLRHLASIL